MQPLLNACCPTLDKIYFKQNFTTSNKHCQVIKHAHYQGIPPGGVEGGSPIRKYLVCWSSHLWVDFADFGLTWCLQDARPKFSPIKV